VRLSKKLAALTITAVAAVGIAGGAFAYWSTTGSGTGTVTAATSNGRVTLHGSIDVSGHAPYPGGSNDVTFTADNASATDLRVGTISLLDVGGVTVDTAHSSCVVSDFSMDPVDSDTTVLAGETGQAIDGTGSLVFANDSDTSQDGCKGAVITLHLQSD
jgi:hypothetical protein